jgi:hypothetical protein
MDAAAELSAAGMQQGEGDEAADVGGYTGFIADANTQGREWPRKGRRRRLAS